MMNLGGGPNRIGQGIEFDYCCCHASFALKEMGFETIMVNSNPETVSTDYDTSDRLYFEPLTFEDVMNIMDVEKPEGVIVQYGGQTPLNFARRLQEAGVPIIGTGRVDRPGGRPGIFSGLLPAWASASRRTGQPSRRRTRSNREPDRLSGFGAALLCVGGRAMRIVYDEPALLSFIDEAKEVSKGIRS